ncbi:hypothetical protein ScalyP_jg3392 [Parmales sp. scaly parma]|nr:hypothetical protein ScalyP_jg3392 [Parmales sp. scaly parma]
MQLTITNTAGVSKEYSMSADATVADLKNQIENETFTPSSMFCLVSGSSAMKAGSLSDFVVDGEELEMVLEVEAGMRAKWRKKRMRRLRRKRRKMRQRAR